MRSCKEICVTFKKLLYLCMKKRFWESSIIIIFVSLVNFLIIFYVIQYKSNIDNANSKSKETQVQNTSPELINVPASLVLVGENFSFYPHFSDLESPKSELILNIAERPAWMKFENDELHGIPTIDDVGNSKLILEISDGENSKLYTFYILVK